MENSVQVILLGIVITAELGTELASAQTQAADRSPRLAA